MAITLFAYADAGLTTPAGSISAIQASDGTAGDVDRVIYLGSTAPAKKFVAASAPGVDQIVVSVADSTAGAGLPPSAIKLATSSSGLATAVAGDPLELGVELLSGVANAVALHIRIDAPAIAAGAYADLSVEVGPVIEVAA